MAGLSAAWWATVAAVPVALLTAVLAFVLLNGYQRSGAPAPGTSASARLPRAQSSAPAAMAAPRLGTRQQTVCRALLSRLPQAIRELVQRPVTAGAEQNAAYGDPAITLACGGTVPSFAPTDTVFPLSGVCWYAVQRPEATAWTTLDREVPVTVTVPGAYDSPGQWVTEFSAPVVATVPTAPEIPFGCR